MDNRAVLIFLCMLCTQAPCKPAGRDDTEEATRAAIKIVLQLVRGLLHQLALPGLLPNTSCSTLNITEDIGLKHQPLSAHRLSSVSCYMQKLSQLPQIPELSDKLTTVVQIIQDTKRLFNSTTPKNCSLPAFEQQLDAHVFARCFLQLVEKDSSS
ncbi:hypothetical protein ATANTOWER_017302 [Ataeniobius toweri]|uniref:Uncharacterized protein n=1 Tax=Ataeniobius toweri TaxID=208326 RepID=A0ABU7BZL2_9TELE|nr:hypothetical protein [Ataeniobius toweri]